MHAPFPHATPVYRTADVRRIEAAAAAGIAPPPLMERAGLAAAELARELAGSSGKPVLVLAGPGNNGGDAFVVARHLQRWFHAVTVVFRGDAAKLSGDAAAALQAWHDAGGTTIDAIPRHRNWSLAIDGLFGIGLQRDISGDMAALVGGINALGVPVLALDVPSGLDADTGRILGTAVRASHTITFIALKPGLLTLDGPDCCGEPHLATLGIDSAAISAPAGTLIGPDVIRSAFPARLRNTHKGSYGSTGIVGGAHGMVGAALLAARAALNIGAGRVYAGLLARDALTVDPDQPELMLRSADAVLKLDHLTSLAVGPGIGQQPDAAQVLGWALETTLPLVLDADALNLIAANEHLGHQLKQRVTTTLLTPHPAEAARLLGTTTADVQRDRIATATRLAREFNTGVVLKGCGSVCAWPDGTWAINPSGNPGMAAAGMGDALTGFLAALLAQGVAPRLALPAGVYLHGAAADRAVADGIGPVGLTATDVIEAARRIVNAR